MSLQPPSDDPDQLAACQRQLVALDHPVVCPPHLRMAAVLVGLCQWWAPQGQGYMLAIRRSSALRDHGGQIGFPGGKVEPSDAGPAVAALRESHEEIGLEASRVHLLGRLSPVPTPTGFWVLPFVGVVDDHDWEPRIDPGEVDQLLRLSRQDLCDPKHYVNLGRVHRNGVSYVRHEYRVCEPSIWGASAHMVHEFLSRTRQDPDDALSCSGSGALR